MKKTLIGLIAITFAVGMSFGGAVHAAKKAPKLTSAEFESSKKTYFQHCAGCHGVLRKGATGKSLMPKDTIKKGTKRLTRIITLGTEGGMNNYNDILTKKEIALMARYIQHEPPIPPEMSMALMKKRMKTFVQPGDYPTKPLHGRNWENFFLVIERDVGKVAVIDGDTHEIIARSEERRVGKECRL